MEKMRWGKGLNKSSGYSPCSSKLSSPSSRTAFDKQLHLRPSQHAGAKSTTGFLSLGWPDASYMLSPNACGLGGFTPSSRCMGTLKGEPKVWAFVAVFGTMSRLTAVAQRCLRGNERVEWDETPLLCRVPRHALLLELVPKDGAEVS